jgi:hypothetical protein
LPFQLVAQGRRQSDEHRNIQPSFEEQTKLIVGDTNKNIGHFNTLLQE